MIYKLGKKTNNDLQIRQKNNDLQIRQKNKQ
jgi:hypothetical protein